MEKDLSKQPRSSSEFEKHNDSDSSAADSIGDSHELAALEKMVWWKLDLCILPIVTMFYFLSWLVSLPPISRIVI